MRSCCAVYVDVGYFLAAAATRVTGSSLRRGVQADYAALIAWLGEHAEADSGLPLLRVNWYDAGGRPGGMPDPSQDEIGRLQGTAWLPGTLALFLVVPWLVRDHPLVLDTRRCIEGPNVEHL